MRLWCVCAVFSLLVTATAGFWVHDLLFMFCPVIPAFLAGLIVAMIVSSFIIFGGGSETPEAFRVRERKMEQVLLLILSFISLTFLFFACRLPAGSGAIYVVRGQTNRHVTLWTVPFFEHVDVLYRRTYVSCPMAAVSQDHKLVIAQAGATFDIALTTDESVLVRLAGISDSDKTLEAELERSADNTFREFVASKTSDQLLSLPQQLIGKWGDNSRDVEVLATPSGVLWSGELHAYKLRVVELPE